MDLLTLLDLCEHCYDHAAILGGPEGRDGALLAQYGDTTILCFRGTLVEKNLPSALDWLNDLRTELVFRPEYPGQVHAGFASSLDDLWGKLPDLPSWPKLIITGHSKGGALAQLAGYRLRQRKPTVITFGSPKVGNTAFAAEYGVACVRYEGDHDVVPRLPPFGYDRVGSVTRPPLGWVPAHQAGENWIVENHALATGYRPWIKQLVHNAAA